MTRLSPSCADEARVRAANFPKSAQKLHAECDGVSCSCPNPHTTREDTDDARH